MEKTTTFRAGADPGTILSALVSQLVDRLGGDGFWDGDYGWGVRVRRPFGARGMSSVRYGTRLGDLKNKQSTHTPLPPCSYAPGRGAVRCLIWEADATLETYLFYGIVS